MTLEVLPQGIREELTAGHTARASELLRPLEQGIRDRDRRFHTRSITRTDAGRQRQAAPAPRSDQRCALLVGGRATAARPRHQCRRGAFGPEEPRVQGPTRLFIFDDRRTASTWRRCAGVHIARKSAHLRASLGCGAGDPGGHRHSPHRQARPAGHREGGEARGARLRCAAHDPEEDGV